MLVRDLATRLARTRADQRAYVQGEHVRTWGSIADRGDLVAAVLQHHGLAKGDRAGIIAQDRIEMIDHWHGCFRSGVVRVGINWRYSPREMAHIVDDGDLRFVLVQAEFVPSLKEFLERWDREGRTIVGFGEGHGLELDFETLLADVDAPPALPDLQPLDAIAISYTSGSTGMPKGAVITQEGAITQLMTAPYAGGFTSQDVILNNLPGSGFPIFIHSYGMSSGATTVLPGLFDAARAIEQINDNGVTQMFCVPTMLHAIEQICRERGSRLPTLKAVITLGSPVVPAIVERARETFGCVFQNWYGSTEATGAICMLRPSDLTGDNEIDASFASSVGRPLLHVDIEIRDVNDQPVGPNVTGEICVRGPVVREYHHMPEESAHALRGGWFHMGDVGHFDDRGFLHLTDRKNFMIVSGGYNVFPAVIETVLADHPSVSEVAVVGAAHPRWGEAVVAIVVPTDPGAADAESLVAFCADRVGTWEVPKYIEFVSALPVGSTGKIQKRELSRKFADRPDLLPWN